MHIKPHWYSVAGLQILALFLATEVQMLGGVRTDEAKYLLNIPYPHPPLMRWLMSATEVLPFQEIFWRVLLATLLIQAVWLIWDMTRSMHHEDRIMVCAGWLLSAAVLTQAGAIMMAPVTALQVLIFVWLMRRPEYVKKFPALLALFWLASLFTALQAVLFVPLIWILFRRNGQSRLKTALYVLAPMGLLALYALSNPLILATIFLKSHQGIGIAESTRSTVFSEGSGLYARGFGLVRLWLIGGAGIASVVGTWGIFKSKNAGLILSFLLLCAYLLLPPAQPYYSILFTPLFVAGLFHIFHGKRHPHAFPLLGCLLFATAIFSWFARPELAPGSARTVMQAIEAVPGSGSTILIAGSFGHEWQYESHETIRRYRPEFVGDARAVVCLQSCDPPFNTSGWKRLLNTPIETWIRK